MDINEISEWLFENGGPVIRYRVATELFPPTKSINVRKLRDDMKKSPAVQAWLKQLALELESTFWMVKIKKLLG